MIKYGNKSSTSKVSRRFVKRTARRIPRAIRNTGVTMKVEYDDYIEYANGATQPRFYNNSLDYSIFYTNLLNNPAFVSQAENFMKFKVTGCTFTATPCFTQTGVNSAFGTSGIPLIFIQQYPILTGSSVGSECVYSDNNLVIKPFSLTQTKYWSYKNNYLIGVGSGVGTWNQTNQVSAQQGQFSVRASSISPAAGVAIKLYSVRMTLYVMLDGKAR